MDATVTISGAITLPWKDMEALTQVGPLEVVQTLLMHDCQVTVEIDVKRRPSKVKAPTAQGGQADPPAEQPEASGEQEESQPATE